MDPNAALERLRYARAAVDRLDGHPPDRDDREGFESWARDLREAFAEVATYAGSLDDWLTGGGFLPQAWDHSTPVEAEAGELLWSPPKFVPVGVEPHTFYVDPTAVTAVRVRASHLNPGDTEVPSDVLWYVDVLVPGVALIAGVYEDESMDDPDPANRRSGEQDAHDAKAAIVAAIVTALTEPTDRT